LVKPSEAVPPTTSRAVEPKLFDRIVDETASGPKRPAGAAWCPPTRQAGG